MDDLTQRLDDLIPSVESKAAKEKRLRMLYRETFKTDNDLLVLTDILNECGFFSMHLKGELDLVKQNTARYILYRLGAWQDFNSPNVVGALRNLPHERT